MQWKWMQTENCGMENHEWKTRNGKTGSGKTMLHCLHVSIQAHSLYHIRRPAVHSNSTRTDTQSQPLRFYHKLIFWPFLQVFAQKVEDARRCLPCFHMLSPSFADTENENKQNCFNRVSLFFSFKQQQRTADEHYKRTC